MRSGLSRLLFVVFSLPVISTLIACASGAPETLEDYAGTCGGKAYDTVFFGGNNYDYNDRATLSRVLRTETEDPGTLSDLGYQRIINEIGPDAAALVGNEFNDCMEDAPEELL